MMMLETMLGNGNEKRYIYIIIVLSIFFSVYIGGSFKGFERRDYELGRTRTELQATAERLRSANERVEQLEKGLTEVGDGLDALNRCFESDNGRFHSVIERLQGIAKEVELLEDRLHNLWNNNGGCSPPSDMEL